MCALTAATFYDMASDDRDTKKNCIFLCHWRHSRMDSHPPLSLMIPRTEALNIILDTMQGFSPDGHIGKIKQTFKDMKTKLQEEQNRFVTRYTFDYEDEKEGKTPINSNDVSLGFCDIFHAALKAAAQCQELTPLDRPVWPIDSDFLERSRLCKKAIELFHSKLSEWLDADPSRRQSYENYLSNKAQKKVDGRRKDIIHKDIQTAMETYYDKPVLKSDVVASTSAPFTLEKRTVQRSP